MSKLKPGMKFLLPITIESVGSDGVLTLTTKGDPHIPFWLNADRLNGLTPEGGWPSEPPKAGDVYESVDPSGRVLSHYELVGPCPFNNGEDRWIWPAIYTRIGSDYRMVHNLEFVDEKGSALKFPQNYRKVVK